MKASPLSLKPIIAVSLSLVVLSILSYSFKIGYEQRFDAYGDAREYIALGTSLAKTGSYGLLDIPNKDLLEDFREEVVLEKQYNFKRYSTWRPPVWPHLIAGVFLVSGYSLTSLLGVKIFLLLLGTFLFYKTLCLLQFSNWIVVLGSFLYVLHPASQMYSRFFLSEPITLFFVTLFLFVAVRLIKGKCVTWVLGLLGGVIILCHPYLVFLPFAIYLFFLVYKKLSFKQVILCGLVTVGVVSLWVLRNAQVLETSKPVITTSSGAVMAKGWNKDVVRSHTNTKGDLADEALVLSEYEYDTKVDRNEVEQSSLYTTAVIDFMRSNPDQVVPIILTKLRSAFNPLAETPKPGFLEMGRVIFHVLSLIALMYVLLFSKNQMGKSVAWALVLATIGITIVTYSGFRFRMPQLVLELFLIVIMLQDIVHNRIKGGHKSLL